MMSGSSRGGSQGPLLLPVQSWIWDPPSGLPQGRFPLGCREDVGSAQVCVNTLCFITAWWGPSTPGLAPPPSPARQPQEKC